MEKSDDIIRKEIYDEHYYKCIELSYKLVATSDTYKIEIW